MSIQGVDSVLTQLRALQARSADMGASKAAEVTPKVDFSSALGDVINGVNDQQQRAQAASTAFVKGSQDVELADVMLALNKADVSFRTLAEVRNRLVSAYQDIMNMPV